MKRNSDKPIKITEVSLRDGSHVVKHQFTEAQVKSVAKTLDDAGMHYIEVSHGDGLGGSTLQYGKSLVDEMKLIEAAVEEAKQATIAVLLIPGIGTVHELKQANSLGAGLVRVATHVTEADVSAQHIEYARKLGMETFGFLMMAHSAPVEKLVEQAKQMESYGAQGVYITDSAGALLPHEVRERVRALRQSLQVEVGFHAHNNLSLAVANTLAAIEEGATRIDGSVRCLGAGAGNTQTEALIAVLNRLGIDIGIDLYKIMDLAEEVVGPILPGSQEIRKGSLAMGYAGVYSSFLLHAERAAKRFNLDSRDILLELGKRKAVGGQEDMILDVAAELAQRKVEM
ncbi:4-hydroxy-2-oxovalerate aldolase [Priestia megaterium]|uniref:4-hydroxy-2-oxovalerate aldolase n=1 Tax=Priestia megaterium (strain ATCC 14581 / DSM 32 / CCUG 1817 / JCM 2506 / NBRC 15308 / NCIMB 9376 / NCTC 10342 / NRRL B-14308 / VKM B-512 / Ford 19) TaxID=1348623 RepID=A0A0B6AW87_PRIM2|nr:4-hydroxy-2-oxovalerate aldolase [Priestia megaterium]AJI24149.1 4-hydroxy-2-oxovalerate aldolase [Priestia megaterium NBRC 15308 = ATCC 14581]KFN05489.1 4-hydroxy-2-oxovalerate aldolase [Priestia megaterium]KGJ78869.1 4-hydroxy-2-oxopentanoic acid aldolase [Priestia megaterium NBRC 15308 = ATCC 14581]MDR4234812.1 4-hydroxy-2-oxovalerate aldolase [Priestia megaterium]MED3805012.1 4-hydroxy-2-oxovalerate aldolase [Priestia megaterium]